MQYLGWSWELVDGKSSIDRGFNTEIEFARISINSDDVVSEVRKDRELKSELLSELATRSIFEWLRVTGYPRCEQDIYRHSWIDLDLEELDEEELDDGISAGRNGFQDATDIHRWMDSALVWLAAFHI